MGELRHKGVGPLRGVDGTGDERSGVGPGARVTISSSRDWSARAVRAFTSARRARPPHGHGELRSRVVRVTGATIEGRRHGRVQLSAFFSRPSIAAMSGQVIAIDGPAGSGKSTVARALAGSLGLVLPRHRRDVPRGDRRGTGPGVDLADEDARGAISLARRVSPRCRASRVNGRDVRGRDPDRRGQRGGLGRGRQSDVSRTRW